MNVVCQYGDGTGTALVRCSPGMLFRLPYRYWRGGGTQRSPYARASPPTGSGGVLSHGGRRDGAFQLSLPFLRSQIFRTYHGFYGLERMRSFMRLLPGVSLCVRVAILSVPVLATCWLPYLAERIAGGIATAAPLSTFQGGDGRRRGRRTNRVPAGTERRCGRTLTHFLLQHARTLPHAAACISLRCCSAYARARCGAPTLSQRYAPFVARCRLRGRVTNGGLRCATASATATRLRYWQDVARILFVLRWPSSVARRSRGLTPQRAGCGRRRNASVRSFSVSAYHHLSAIATGRAGGRRTILRPSTISLAGRGVLYSCFIAISSEYCLVPYCTTTVPLRW